MTTAENATDFKWSDENTILRPQYRTAVYTNPWGELVLRQQDYPEEDTFIVIGRPHVADVIKAMAREAGVDLASLAKAAGRKSNSKRGGKREA